MFSKSEPKRTTSSTDTVLNAKLRTRIISWHTPAQMKRERVMCSVPRGSDDAAALAAHVGVGEIHDQQHVVFARRGGQQQRPQAGNRQRETRQVAHAAAIQARLAARLGVDVADFVEQAEAVVVAQCMRALAARHVGGDDLVQLDVGNGGFRGQRCETSCR